MSQRVVEVSAKQVKVGDQLIVFGKQWKVTDIVSSPGVGQSIADLSRRLGIEEQVQVLVINAVQESRPMTKTALVVDANKDTLSVVFELANR